MRAIYLMLEAWSIVFKIKLQPKKEMDMIKKLIIKWQWLLPFHFYNEILKLNGNIHFLANTDEPMIIFMSCTDVNYIL